MSWLFRICPSVGLEQDPWVSLMLQGHFIPRKLLLHILHFHWSKSVHWNVWEWNAKLKKYIFLNLLDHLQSMAIVLVPLLHSSNFVKFTATLYTLLSLTCFFFSIFLEASISQFTPWNTCHNPYRLNGSNKILEKDVFLFCIQQFYTKKWVFSKMADLESSSISQFELFFSNISNSIL